MESFAIYGKRTNFVQLLMTRFSLCLLMQMSLVPMKSGAHIVANECLLRDDTIYIDATTPMLNPVVDSLSNRLQGTRLRAAQAGSSSVVNEFGYYDPYANMPQTPKCAALSKMTNSQVNYAYGLPEIKIPIYDMVIDDIVIPIYLEYNASGIKVNDPYSPVGAGWSLHAEPTITRTVMGLPDEEYYLTNGYTTFHNIDDGISWIYKKNRDKMPDKFYYQLLDKSGGFNLDGTPYGSFVIHPFEPIRIDYSYAYSHINDFTIHDDKGLEYYFGNSSVATSTSGTSVAVDSEWKCEKVTSLISGRKVYFDYLDFNDIAYYDDSYAQIEYYENDGVSIMEESDPYLFCLQNKFAVKLYDYSGAKQVKSLVFYNKSDGKVSTAPEINRNKFNMMKSQFPEHPMGADMHNLLIYAIRSGDYKVEFEYKTFPEDGTKALKSITVRNGIQTIRKIIFYISKMASHIKNPHSEHCKLDSFRIENGGGSYHFSYYEPESFPERFSKARDFWGYYNGHDNNITLVPKQAYDVKLSNKDWRSFTIGDAHREPYLQDMRKGSLMEIKYPTGGRTLFEYETHEYTYVYYSDIYPYGSWPQTYRGGGLRIKSIVDYTVGDETPQKRAFSYGKGHCKYPPMRSSNDSIGRFLQYAYRNCTYHYYRNTISVYQQGVINTNVVYFPANSFMEYPLRYGSTVVYDDITEQRSDGSKSVFYYEYGSDIDTNEPQIYAYADYWSNCCYGLPILRRDFAKDSNGYKLVHSVRYIYNSNYNYRSTPGYNYIDNMRFYGDIDEAVFKKFPTTYPNFYRTGSNKLVETRDSVFDANGRATVTVTTYSYSADGTYVDPLAYCRKVTTTYADNTSTSEETKYPTDMTLSSEKEQARQKLVSQWLVNTPLEKSVSRNGHKVTVVGFDYGFWGSDSIPRLTALRFGKTMADRERVSYSEYTAYGKPMCKVTDGIRKTVYLYSYQGEHIVAVIDNAAYNVVRLAMGGDAAISTLCAKGKPDDADWAKLESLKNKLPFALVTVYRHQPYVGVSRIAAPGTAPVSYDYDQIGRLTNSWLESGTDKWLLEHNRYNYINK